MKTASTEERLRCYMCRCKRHDVKGKSGGETGRH